MTKELEFPQPERDAPPERTEYFFAKVVNPGASVIVGAMVGVGSYVWSGDKFDFAILRANALYLDRGKAEQRLQWQIAEANKRVFPRWLTALGPNVERRDSKGNWTELKSLGDAICQEKLDEGVFASVYIDWWVQDPTNFRAKRPDVVRIVGNKEFRWPATVDYGAIPGDRWVFDPLSVRVINSKADREWGERVHFTKEGAEAQLAAYQELMEGPQA